MAKPTKQAHRKYTLLPNLKNRIAFERWLTRQPREWAVALAVRSALRVLPHLRDIDDGELAEVSLAVFHATAITWFAAKYPEKVLDAYPYELFGAVANASADAWRATSFATTAATTSAAAAVRSVNARIAANDANKAIDAALGANSGGTLSELESDARLLDEGALTPYQLVDRPLWLNRPPSAIDELWRELSISLRAQGRHWQVWIDWYESIVAGIANERAYSASFTDMPGRMPWEAGSEALNVEIAWRLSALEPEQESLDVPNQSPAPVCVEERDGRISQQSNRDGALSAVERDFRDWRDPILDHVGELVETDFASGTNHALIRNRLTAFAQVLPGEIAEVKDRQFRIGYEIERFEGLLAAYRSNEEDMPKLNAAQLEELEKLRIALKMGIDKLERWVEFSKRASKDTAGEGNADPEVVREVLDEIAISMERKQQYFDPKLPASFRFLSEALRDPFGATKTVIYGAVKSAENLLSFLGRRALAVGEKVVDAVETHTSKAVAASLIAGFSGAALALSAALPQGWAWLKPLLAALGIVG